MNEQRWPLMLPFPRRQPGDCPHQRIVSESGSPVAVCGDCHRRGTASAVGGFQPLWIDDEDAVL